MTVTLYSKPGCHLCEDVLERLQGMQSELRFTLEEVDITADAQLFARYRYEIPVVLKDGVEIARGAIDARDLETGLRVTSR